MANQQQLSGTMSTSAVDRKCGKSQFSYTEYGVGV